LQTHLRSTRHNQLLIERFDQKNDGENKKQPKQNEIVIKHSLISKIIVFFRFVVD